MTPFEKTLDHFRQGKNSADSSTREYWRAGEMVPVHELLPYREYNRKTQEKFPGHFDEIKSQIEKNGIHDMGILLYNHKTHRVYAGEGNTRLAIAKELGFTHVPMRVYRMSHDNPAGGIAPRPWSREGHVPADIKPSEIGFTPMKVDEGIIDSILREAEDIEKNEPIRDVNWQNSQEHEKTMFNMASPMNAHKRDIDLGDGWALRKSIYTGQYGRNNQFSHTHYIMKEGKFAGLLHVASSGRDHATVSVDTHNIFDDPEVFTRPQTKAGPKYNAGFHVVRRVGRELARMYPHIQYFGGQRITGGLSKYDPSDPNAHQGATRQQLVRENQFNVPGLESVSTMLDQICEGTFDWSELERLYGHEFPQSNTAVQEPSNSDIRNIAGQHGYKKLGDVAGTTMYLHPEGHGLDVHRSGEWVHTPAHSKHEEDAVWNTGVEALRSHLHTFHRGW